MKNKQVLCLIMIITTVVFMTACGNASGQPVSTVPTPTESSSAVSGESSQESVSKSGGYKIAFCDTSQNITWRVQMLAEFEQAATELVNKGVISEYYVTNADEDTSKQISDVRDMIAKGVDGILIAASSPTAVIPVIDEAMQAGIKVVNFNSLLESDNVTAKVYQSDVEFGRICAQFIADSIDGKGNIIVLNGVAGNSVSNARWEGAEKVFSQYPDIKIVGESYAGWEYGRGKAAVESLLSVNPVIDAVWSQGGAITQGAIDAFVEAGRELVPMSGEAGNGFLRIWKHYMGVDKFDSIAPNYTATISIKALDVLIDALDGKQVEKEIVLPITTITSSNIDEYYREDLSDSFWCDTQLTEESLHKLFGK